MKIVRNWKWTPEWTGRIEREREKKIILIQHQTYIAENICIAAIWCDGYFQFHLKYLWVFIRFMLCKHDCYTHLTACIICVVNKWISKFYSKIFCFTSKDWMEKRKESRQYSACKCNPTYDKHSMPTNNSCGILWFNQIKYLTFSCSQIHFT